MFLEPVELHFLEPAGLDFDLIAFDFDKPANKPINKAIFVNKKGVLAVGHIVNGQVVAGNTVFNADREFHVKVEWETIVDDDNPSRRGATLMPAVS